MRRLLIAAVVLVLALAHVTPAAGLSVTSTIAVGAQPFGVAYANGNVYVANSGGSTLSVIDTATARVVGSVTVGSGPGEVAVDAAAGRAYVGNFNDGTVSVVDTVARSTIATLAPGGLGVAVDPGLARLYATSGAQLTVYDTATRQQVAAVLAPSGTSWWAVAVDPVTHLGYLGDLAGHGVTVLDLTTNAVVATIDVGGPVRLPPPAPPARGGGAKAPPPTPPVGGAPSAGRSSSSVSRVRSAAEQRTSSGSIPSRTRCLATRFASRRPLRASGRSWSASVGSEQLDFACRRR